MPNPLARLDPPLTESRLVVAVAAVGCALVYFFATATPGASLHEGIYHPWGFDSFYVAALIRDIVEQYPTLKEFDGQLHPRDGGAWISFTWGFLTLMASLVKAAQTIDPELATSTAVAHIPPVWGMLNCLLLIGVCRQLGCGVFTTALAALGFALAPYVRELHLLGNIDHHFIELFFILLVIYTFLRWLRRPDSWPAAAFAGAALGISIAFHFVLFVLYAPIAAFLLIEWIRGRCESRPAVFAFVAAVLAATLVAVLPSAHLRDLEFDYFYLSWFHVYWAAVFCTAVVYLHRLPFTPARLAVLLAALLLAAVPAIGNLWHGVDFLAADLPGFSQLNETYSVFAFLFSGDPARVNQVYLYYTGLLFVLPFALLLLIRQARLTPAPRLIYAACACVYGALFLLLQTRFSYHGPYVLLLPLLLLYEYRPPGFRPARWLLIAILAIAYLGPALQLTAPKPLGGQPGYAGLVPFYRVIAEQCDKRPGVLLAHPDEGHYLRYHTRCQIVASNMLASARDFEYRALALRMFAMPVAELLEQYAWVDYIYVRREGGFQVGAEAERRLNRGIRNELLLERREPPGTRTIAYLDIEQGLYLRLLQTFE